MYVFILLGFWDFMTPLQALLPELNKFAGQLELHDQVDIDLILATKLTSGDPEGEQYLERGCRALAGYITECRLHKVIGSYTIPFDRAISSFVMPAQIQKQNFSPYACLQSRIQKNMIYAFKRCGM